MLISFCFIIFSLILLYLILYIYFISLIVHFLNLYFTITKTISISEISGTMVILQSGGELLESRRNTSSLSLRPHITTLLSLTVNINKLMSNPFLSNSLIWTQTLSLPLIPSPLHYFWHGFLLSPQHSIISGISCHTALIPNFAYLVQQPPNLMPHAMRHSTFIR